MTQTESSAPRQFSSRKYVYAVAIVASFAVSVLALLDNNTINRDGVLYLKAAHYFTLGEFDLAEGIFTEPFYSLLIAGVSAITPLGVEGACYLLNAIFCAILVAGFMRIVECMGGDRQLLVYAAVIILVFPNVNEYRTVVVRDMPYLAIFMLMFLAFYRFYLTGRLSYLLAWFALVLIGALFRVESAAFLFMPVCLFFVNDENRAQQLLLAKWLFSAGVALVILVGAIIMVVNNADLASVQVPGLGETRNLVYGSYLGYWLGGENLSLAKQFLNDLTRINQYSENYGGWVLLSTVVAIVVGEIASTVTWVLLPFVLFALIRRHALFNADYLRVFAAAGIVSLAILAAFGTTLFFLTERYALPLALLLLTLIPRVFYDLMRRHAPWSRHPECRRWVGSALIILLVLSFLDGVVSTGTSRSHLKEAGLWLAEVSVPTKSVFANDPVTKFYSGSWDHTPDTRLSYEESLLLLEQQPKLLAQHRFVALNIHRDKDLNRASELLKRQPVEVFSNRKGDRVVIFDTQSKVGS